jgi:MurNAc alpha-1-phosphate uridylyltransferase
VTFDAAALAEWEAIWAPIRAKGEAQATVFCHRDYHAENLIWLPEREGAAKVGMLDFQDAVLAHPAWDLSMLLHDARRTVSPEREAACLDRYLAARPALDRTAFLADYHALGALNIARILGIFARLVTRDGKPRYEQFMPRLWTYLDVCLADPALAHMKAWFDRHVPLRPAHDHRSQDRHGPGRRPRHPHAPADRRPAQGPGRGGWPALIDHMLDRLVEAGVETAVVNVHYFADLVEAHLTARQAKGLGPRIVISDERPQALETGGGIKHALPLLGEGPVWVANIDSVWIENGAPALDAVAAAWDPARMDVCLLLASTAGSLGFHDSGDVFLDDGVVRFKSPGEMAPLVYVGVHICKPEITADGPEGPFSLLPIWKGLAADHRVHGVSPERPVDARRRSRRARPGRGETEMTFGGPWSILSGATGRAGSRSRLTVPSWTTWPEASWRPWRIWGPRPCPAPPS